jgi:hypothetical protein
MTEGPSSHFPRWRFDAKLHASRRISSQNNKPRAQARAAREFRRVIRLARGRVDGEITSDGPAGEDAQPSSSVADDVGGRSASVFSSLRHAHGLPQVALMADAPAMHSADSPSLRCPPGLLYLDPGDRSNTRSKLPSPWISAIHYHQAQSSCRSLVKTLSDAGVFAPSLAQDYCP